MRRQATALVTLFLLASPSSAQHEASADMPWMPEIPRVWVDAEMARVEVPLAAREHSPRHVPGDYYYAIPERTIYRDYPVYHPDHEPPGYWEWLHEREPEVAFDPEELETKEDWVRAGELVFRQGAEYTAGTELRTVRDPEAYAAVGIPLTEDGRFPYARYVVREKGTVELETNSCAGCHTRVIDGEAVLGGASDNPLGRIIEYELRNEAARAEEEGDESGTEPDVVDRDSGDYRFAAAPWLEPDPGAFVIGMTGDQIASLLGALHPGVFVRQRTSYEHPVRTPDLFGVAERRFLDATGVFESRELIDLARYAALNEGLDELASYGGFRPRADDFETLPDPATQVRSSDEQLYALALFLESLEPPANPNPRGAAAERGAALFETEGCVRCHTPPLYTNDRLVVADGFTPTADEAARLRPIRTRVGTDPGLTLRTRRGTGYYKVPSLKNAWARGPFLHDGSVATLEDLFDPRRLEPDYVPTGYAGPFGDRRSVPGHEFGLELSTEERADLIAFLRTL